MIEFCELFKQSKGKPIQYKDKTLVAWDQIQLPSKITRVKYKIVSTDSEWNQGIAFRTKGSLEFDTGQKYKKGWMVLMENLVDWENEFTCYSKSGLLDVKNVWETDHCPVESWINGAAMWIEEIPNGRRYHCNDGHFDDDLNDLIFELTIKTE